MIFKNYNAIHNVLTRKLRMPPSTHLCFSAQYVFSQRSVFDSSRALKFSIHTSLHKLFCLLLLRTEDGPKHCCRKSIGNSINAQMRNDHGGCEFLILPSIKRVRAHSMKHYSFKIKIYLIDSKLVWDPQNLEPMIYIVENTL